MTEAAILEKRATLKPTKRYRRVVPRVCATCRFCSFVVDDDGEAFSVYQCQRNADVCFDAGDGYQWYYTCDRYETEET